MSVGNLKDQGNKGNNFPYQFRMLKLLGDIRSQLATGQTIIKDGVNSSGLLGMVPAGFMLEMIVAQPIGGAAPIVIDYGITAGGSQLLPGETVTPPNPTTSQLNYTAPGKASFSVYATSGAWGLGTVSFYLIIRKIG